MTGDASDDVPPAQQCTMRGCDQPATDDEHPAALCPSHLPDDHQPQPSDDLEEQEQLATDEQGHRLITDGGQPQTTDASGGDTAPETPLQGADTDDAGRLTDARDIPDDDLRDYYERAVDVWEAMSTFQDTQSLIVPGTSSDRWKNWYKKDWDFIDRAAFADDDGDVESVHRARPWSATADRDDIVDEVLGMDYRLPHLTINYQQRGTDEWATVVKRDGDKDWQGGKPLPDYGDIDAVALFADVDFSADAKERPVDDQTRDRIESILQHWVDEYASVVDDSDAVALLDSVGGTYVMLRPAVTAPIASFAADALDAAERTQLMNELQSRWKAFNSDVDDRAANWDAFGKDGDTNKNRLFKAPLAVHKELPGVVTPIDSSDPSFEFTHWDDVDDALIEQTRDWAQWFTSDEPDKADDWAGQLLASLFNSVDADNWRDDLEGWADERKQADSVAQKETFDDIDAKELAGDVTFVSDRDAVWDKIAAKDCETVADELDIKSNSQKAQNDDRTLIEVNWRESGSGDSAFVGHTAFTDMDGMNKKGGPATLVAYNLFGGDKHEPENWRSDPAKIEQVLQWFYNNSKFDVPLHVPQQGSEYESDGETRTHSRTPNWAIRRVAELLDIAPDIAFNDAADECIIPSLHNRILQVLDAAGIDHNRDEKDVRVDVDGDDVVANEHDLDVDELVADSPADIPAIDDTDDTSDDDPDDSDAADAPTDDAADDADSDEQSTDAQTWAAKYGIADRDSVSSLNQNVAVPGVELQWIELADGRAGWGWTYEYTDDDGQPRQGYNFVLNADLELLSRLDYPERRGQQTEWRVRINPTVGGEPQREVTLTPAAFNSARELRDELIGQTESVVFNSHGKGAKAVNELKQLVHAQDAPRRKAHEKIELVDTDDGAVFVTPNGTIDADGWIDDPQHVFESVADGIKGDWQADPDVVDDVGSDLVADVCELLPRIRDDKEQWLSMLGYAFASTMRPVLFDQPASQVDTWNLLHVSGKSGAGKSAVAKTLSGALGMNAKSTTGAEKTPHAQEHMFSATNGMPVAMDEYNPTNWANYKADTFHELLKKSTDAQSIEKGNADQSLTEYRFEVSPMVLGEQQLPESMPALPRRAVEVTLQTMSTATDTDTADRFNSLRGLKDDDYGLGLHHHAVDWWSHVCDAAESPIDVVNEWHETADWMRDRLLDKRGLDLNDELPRPMHQQGLQTVAFGLRRWRAFARDRGADPTLLFDDSDIIDTLEHLIAEKTGAHASSVDNESALLELLGDAAAIQTDGGEFDTPSQEYAAYGEHYTAVHRETDQPTELRIHLKSTLTQLSKFSRDYGIDATLYQRSDYFKWFKSAAENPDSMVTDANTRARLGGSNRRCVSVRLEQLTDELDVHEDDLIPDWVLTDVGDDDNDDDSDTGETTPDEPADIDDLQAGDQNVAVAGTVDTVDDDQADQIDHKATISDDTGSIEATVWDESVTLSVGDDVAVVGAYVNTFDDRLQLNINDSTTVDLEESERDDDPDSDDDDAGDSGGDDPDTDDDTPGSDSGETTSSDDETRSDGGNRTDADTDADGQQADDDNDPRPGLKRSVYQELEKHDTGGEVTAAKIATPLGLSEQQAADALDHIAAKGNKIERINDGYRLL